MWRGITLSGSAYLLFAQKSMNDTASWQMPENSLWRQFHGNFIVSDRNSPTEVYHATFFRYGIAKCDDRRCANDLIHDLLCKRSVD